MKDLINNKSRVNGDIYINWKATKNSAENTRRRIQKKLESEALTPEDRSRLRSAIYGMETVERELQRVNETLSGSDDLFCVMIPSQNGPEEDGNYYVGYVYAETIFEAFQKIEVIGGGTRDFTKLRGEDRASFYTGSVYCQIFKFAGIHKQLVDFYEDLGDVAFNETQAYDDYINGYNKAKDKASKELSDSIRK